MITKLNRYELDERWARLTSLLEPVHRKALGTARRLCRSDEDGDGVYQDAVLRAFEKLHTLKDEDRFKSWFFCVLVSVHRTRYRRSFWKRYASLTSIDDSSKLMISGATTPEDDVLGAKRMRRALACLKAPQREAVVLFEIEGFSIEEISKIQESSIPAVKSRLVRGRARLRTHYEKYGLKSKDTYKSQVPARELPEGG